MAETIVLDPSEVATSRTQVDLTPWVKGDGIDWGDAQIAAYMAEQARGASPVDFRVPNRTVTIPLVLKAVGGTSFAMTRTTVQAKAALFQREGGWLKRLTSSGGTVFADITSATLKLGGGWMQAHRSADLDAVLTLDVLPDFYGGEVTLPDHTTTTATELVFTETGILGDYPGRCRIVVDEDDGDRQLGLIWGLRSRSYDAAATARLAYNAGTLTPQDAAAVVATTIEHAAVSSMWTPILKTDIIPSGALTHVGTYRIWAQVRSVGTTNRGVDVRLLWDVGDLSTPVLNTSKRIPGPDTYSLDLGEVRLDRAKSGTHRWQGQIQAKATTAPADVIVSKVWIVPVDDGYGVLRASMLASSAFSAFIARDSFNQSAGALTGKTASVGGVWAGAGDADDSVVEAVTGHNLQRTAVSDANHFTGRYHISGAAAFASQTVQVDVYATTIAPGGLYQGVLARYIDTNNWVRATVLPAGPAIYLHKRVAGTVSQVAVAVPPITLAANTWATIRVTIDAAGRWYVWLWRTYTGPTGPVYDQATFTVPPVLPALSGTDTDFATGGALASGKPGIHDAQVDATANTRVYDNFLSYVPTFDAVLHPSQSAELRTEGMFREDETGASYAPVPTSTYDLPRLPPAGLEGRTCEVFLKGSRGDYDQLPDSATDDISARIFYRPCWLFVP